jgi:hypothetical protein
MESCKSIGHLSVKDKDQTTKDTDLGKDADEINYILFYLLERLNFIYEQALKEKLEGVCSHMVSVLGKITISSAKFDLSLASTPIFFIGQIANKSLEQGSQEIADKATFTLMEISKVILNEIDFTYFDLKDPFFSIITQLDIIGKATFKRDKSINIKILIQPFLDLKELFKSEKASKHQDCNAIVGNINRILGEYEALDMIMRTIPPLPKS